ncbi:hypothetical protein LTR37_006515 [Vermiconidia calcicola]|uniref:Uncharacterized protein n=1 Tax=Vermiconidia calcicola TaxID=1690605 RepID=A0ACC3NGH3_9PEZI|nr:hypothetical protein LTR37_006515 [Vermiconidia calcicola]
MGNNQSKFHPSPCKQDCYTCAEQYVPSATKQHERSHLLRDLDDAEAQDAVQQLIDSTQDNYQHIRERLDLYGNAIAKRWQESTAKKRGVLLRSAMPDLLTNRYSIVHSFYTRDRLFKISRQSASGRIERETANRMQRRENDRYLLPNLDEASLSKSATRFLALMRYRAYARPADWFLFDAEQSGVEFHHSGRTRLYNPHCVVLRGKNFGQLIQWEVQAAHRWDIVGFPRAHFVLGVQFNISQLIRRTLDQLLERGHGSPPLGRYAWYALVATEFRSPNPSVERPAYYDQQFFAPPRFDARQAAEMFRLRHDSTYDELQRVQTDPLYARHRIKQVEDLAIDKTVSEKDKQLRICTYPLHAVTNFVRWGWLSKEAEFVSFAWKKCNRNIVIGSPLPLEYSYALDRFEACLVAALTPMVEELGTLLAYSPAFQ